MLTKINGYARYTVKIYKHKPQFFFQTGGRAPGAPVRDQPLDVNIPRPMSITLCIKLWKTPPYMNSMIDITLKLQRRFH